MGYDRGDSFPFNFEPNGNPLGSKLKVKLSPRSYPIQCESKWKYSFLSVGRKTATDRLIAVRETGVSRHQGGPIEGPPETPRTSLEKNCHHDHIPFNVKGIGNKVFSAGKGRCTSLIANPCFCVGLVCYCSNIKIKCHYIQFLSIHSTYFLMYISTFK